MLLAILLTTGSKKTKKKLKINHLIRPKAGKSAILGEEHQHFLEKRYKDFPLKVWIKPLEASLMSLRI